jgi:hypothetical protein
MNYITPLFVFQRKIKQDIYLLLYAHASFPTTSICRDEGMLPS